MKGVSFQKPLEFQLEVDGESWSQGDPIRGSLKVRNHDGSAQPIDGVKVALASGELKEVRQKAKDAFEIIAARNFKPGERLESKSEATLSWEFETDRNCQITDSSASLFVLYGSGEAPEKLAQLQLRFTPYWIVQEYLKTFETTFRFVVKGAKSSKGWIEAKLAPPAARNFATLELIIVSFRFEGETFEVRYRFQVKKIQATAAAIDVKKEKREHRQEIPRSEYLIPSGRVNYDRIEDAIREALALVESKITF